jgi:hypothetical protein
MPSPEISSIHVWGRPWATFSEGPSIATDAPSKIHRHIVEIRRTFYFILPSPLVSHAHFLQHVASQMSKEKTAFLGVLNVKSQ